MSLHRRRRLRRLGLPEVVAVIIVAFTVWMMTVWWRSAEQPGWEQTGGRIRQCSIRNTHYNAEPNENVVHLSFEYFVGGMRYANEWTGIWPLVESPDALSPGQMDELTSGEHILTVFFDPLNPAHCQLHSPRREQPIILTLLALASLVFALTYFLKIYPAWRNA